MLFLKGNSLLTKCHLTKTLNIQILYSLSALTHLVYGLLQAQGISEEKKKIQFIILLCNSGIATYQGNPKWLCY